MASTSLTEALRETLALFGESGVPMTTTEVADQLDLGRRSTYERLERLVDHDRLETKKVGANARVWWRPSPEAGRGAPDSPAAARSLLDDVLDGVEVGVFVLDENFDVAWINEATERYFGLDRAHVLGRNKRCLTEERIAPLVADGETFAETVLATYEDNTDTEQFECHVPAGDGRAERWLEHRSKPIESGAYAGGRVELYYDVTDRKRAERARREEQVQFESLVEAVEEYAIFRLDTDGYVQTWNSGAKRIKRYGADDTLGEHFSTFYPEDARAAGVPERNLAAAAEHGSVEDEGWRVRADGSRFWANVTITAIRGDDGELQGYAKVTRDMTERREREQELRRERDLTDQLLETAPVRLAVFRADGSIERINSRARQQLDIDESPVSELAIEDVDLYDVDGDPLETANYPSLRVIETGEPVSDQLVQHDGPNGERRWVSLTAAPLPEEDGTVERSVIAGRDVTELKRKEQQLERQRDELEHELAAMFERVDDAFYALDEEFRFEYVNDTAETYFGRSGGELLGRNVWEVVDVDEDDPIIERFETAMASQEPTSFERYSDPLGIWASVNVYPSDTGLSVYFRDITDRKERERELQQYRTIVETVDDGVYVLDDEDRFQLVNEAHTALTDYDREELLGAHASMVTDEEYVSLADDAADHLRKTENEATTVETELVTSDGNRIPVETRFTLLPLGDDRYGRVGVVRDITERKERERELEQKERRFQTLVENFPNGAVALVDHDLRYTTFGGTPEGETDLTREDLEGELLRDVLPPKLADVVIPGYEEALDGNASKFVETVDDGVYQFQFLPVRDEDGDVFLAMATSQDITERKAHERELWDRIRQQEVVADLGTRALKDLDLDTLMAEAADLVAETLDNDYCNVLDLDTEAEELLLRQGVGWEEGLVGEATVSAVEDDSQAAYTLATEQPVVVEDLATEPWFDGPDFLRDHDVRSGISTIIGPADDPWGILGTHDTDCKEPSEQDATFVQSVANILAAAIDRYRHEQELVHQREQLDALNSLNEIVGEITDAVLDQSTREEIEATVCEHLAALDSYLFAWIAEVDPQTMALDPHVEAGVEGYLEEVPTSMDPDEPSGQGPGGRAIRTREIQTTQDTMTDPDFEPWREHAKEYGYQSAAGIPITHDGTLYGLLGVYADRPNAFEGREREVIGQLGEVVGHAIAATERKRALISDEVTEIGFVVPEFTDRAGTNADVGGTITFDRAVPAGDESFLVYGTADATAIDPLKALAEQLSYVEEMSVFDQGPETAWFELRLSGFPIMSIIASHGGYLQQGRLEDGDLYLTVDFPTTVDTRRIVDAIEEVYPTVTMLKRRQVTRSHDTSARIQQTVTEDLSDRQRTALEAAVYSGYFEWPRDTTGQDLAKSLGVSQATLSQHLRKAERKVFESIFPIPATA